MKTLLIILLLNFASFITNAQLKPGSSVFLTFEETKGEVNVNGNDALDMLKSYLVGKTSIVLWDSKETADFVLNLQIVEKNIGNRNGKLVVIDNKTKLSIFESKWVRGTSNAFYGYSGSRHAIGKLVKDELIDAFPAIEKKD